MIRRRHGKGPRRRRWEEGLREKRGRSIFLLPSLLTTGNLFCGFLALLLTAQGRYTDAATAIFIAMVMDLLDGRVARLMKATSQFGVEYDSLADVVSFCVAPAFLVFAFALSHLGRPAWFAAFLFVICGALRLARFNVATGVADKRFFTGLSTPAAAAVICSTVVLLQGIAPPRAGAVAIAVGTYLVALLMVSTFKYWSFKELSWARQHPGQMLLVIVLGVMIVATEPELFLFIIFMGYAISGPVRRLVVGSRPAPMPEPVKDTL
jgi:CDP-diacylglycerol---serine O-phosphatidyltransferase